MLPEEGFRWDCCHKCKQKHILLFFCTETIPTRFIYTSLHYNPVLHHKVSFVLAAVKIFSYFARFYFFARDQKRLIRCHMQLPKERERSTNEPTPPPPPHPPPPHRVGSVLSFFYSRRNWDSPNPSPAGECAPPPPGSGGRGTLAGKRGG